MAHARPILDAQAYAGTRADYKDGKLVPPKPGAAAEPRPTAGVTGTQITVEDLFYNVATRRQALQSTSEEYGRILDVMQRYAVEHAGVSFICKKVGPTIWVSQCCSPDSPPAIAGPAYGFRTNVQHGSTAPDLATQATATRLDNLRTIYGAGVARELLPLQYNSASNQFRVEGYVSNANYSMKKFTFLLFINRTPMDRRPVLR